MPVPRRAEKPKAPAGTNTDSSGSGQRVHNSNTRSSNKNNPQEDPAQKPSTTKSSAVGCPNVCPPGNSTDDEKNLTLHRSNTDKRIAFVKVLDCGATAEQGTRRTMEDQHTMLSEGIPFFGVYDGHGGTQCAEYLRDNLHQMILSHTEIKTNPEKAIYDGITEADRLFLQRSEVETNESGSVCAVALILDDVLVVGNVGDCEAVLSRRGAPVVLTKKHNLQSNPAEMQRLKDAGGKIFHNRVGHPKFNPSVVSLAVTRAIGDAGFKLDEYTDGKPSGVIAEPDTSSTKLTHEDEFLIIGCDGLWDVMTYEEVVDFCFRRFHNGLCAQAIAAQLAHAALNKGSTDNVTAMLVFLTRGEGPDKSSEHVLPMAAVSTSVRNLSEEP